ncbi:MAG: metallophosphoesterase [Lentisphaeria bacterium]|nr:metallophosphoesterase [Lentisphaeria bacterium]
MMIKKIAAAVTVMSAAVILTACALQSGAKQEPAQPQKPAVAAPAPAAPAKAKAKAKAAWKAPQLSHPDAWTMIVVPDVQAYTERPRNHGILDIMNAWIVDSVEPLKIQQVLFTGDLVYRNDQNRLTPDKNSLLGKEQWKAFSRLMERLDGRVPYILCTGNHDYGHNTSENRHTWFNEFFPTDRNPQTRKQLIGCNYNAFDITTLETSAYEFTAPAPDNRKFLVITLQFAPTDADLKWAKKLADQPRFKNHIGIVLTHSYLRYTGERIEKEKYVLSKQGGNPGEQIFQKLVYPAKNIRLVVCGHIAAPDKWERGIAFSTAKNSSGKTVAQMAFNTQAIGGGFHGSGGDGWLRILEFMPDRKTVKATTYSPFFAISPSTRHLSWKHDKLSEFTFTIE